MTILFDVEPFAAAEREEAYQAALVAATAPHRVRFLAPGTKIHARVSRSVLDRDMALLRTETAAVVHERGEPELRHEGPQLLAFVLHDAGPGQYEHAGHGRPLRRGELCVTDLNGVFAYRRPEAGVAHIVQVERARLGVSVETVRLADHRLPGSPLYDLVRRHMAALVDQAPLVESPEAQEALAQATAHLLRGLLITAVDDGRRGREAVQDQLLARIRLYVQQHCCDPGLDPARIAQAHAISVRHLFRLWQSEPLALTETVMELRLEAARRRLLAQPRSPVVAIARACGFSDASHFSRRFRRACGYAPGEWRDRHRGGPTS
ncbi:helix-turn-helix domain-containing protein [Streptomyces sp. NPDC052040]|uniref:helix-turn-helix domain-containing protein n=1 Tax=unclassified Streptomyces TaxID=2593676 RepID=UPI0037D0732E